MMVEIAGSRVLAPFLGSSIVTWTSLIGVILGSLSVGYRWGGALADKRPSPVMLGFLLFLSGIGTALIPLLRGVILPLLSNVHDLRASSLLASLLLFAPASVFLGTIPPYAARLMITDVDTSGSAVGRLSAFSALGSIVGTFLTGYVLLALVGNTMLLILLAATLILASFLVIGAGWVRLRQASLAALLVFAIVVASEEREARKHGHITFDTTYNWYEIYDVPAFQADARDDPRLARVLTTDRTAIQSAMYLDSNDLPLPYTRYYRLSDHFLPTTPRALLIGGGAYTVAKDFLRRNPSGRIDVVEIDPELTPISTQYFGLEDDARLRIFNEDGRTFINKPGDLYDAIYLDAYNDSFSMPYHLATKEMVQHMWDHLNERGVVIVNFVSGVVGENATFFKAEYATYAAVFPQVLVFRIDDDLPADDWQNIILVGRKSMDPPTMVNADPELASYLAKWIRQSVAPDAVILTDDFAPVDQYLIKAAF